MPWTPEVAVVLGSGLGGFAARLADPVVLPYDALPHWPPARVVGHEGRLVAGMLAGRRVAALAGRAHFYEGHDLRSVTLPVRAMGLLGTRIVVLTNAAGGIAPHLEPGTLMIIDDHINLMGDNPLVGPNDDRLGPRFPDMTAVYSPRLRALADAVAQRLGLRVAHGVYAALRGPSYETPAEIRYLRIIGADAVGMSTVPEAIAARHMGLEVLGVSCITNMAAGILPKPLDHDEVMETARRLAGAFERLLEGV
ncbi:MAG TPA: purine-nucleoside phosphorylase, partial [Candidatus Tectomicrobia bacterium]|nr:purine-nucleoside phosphorylase [Candidatus Tectomicrobia bacterium]